MWVWPSTAGEFPLGGKWPSPTIGISPPISSGQICNRESSRKAIVLILNDIPASFCKPRFLVAQGPRSDPLRLFSPLKRPTRTAPGTRRSRSCLPPHNPNLVREAAIMEGLPTTPNGCHGHRTISTSCLVGSGIVGTGRTTCAGMAAPVGVTAVTGAPTTVGRAERGVRDGAAPRGICCARAAGRDRAAGTRSAVTIGAPGTAAIVAERQYFWALAVELAPSRASATVRTQNQALLCFAIIIVTSLSENCLRPPAQHS